MLMTKKCRNALFRKLFRTRVFTVCNCVCVREGRESGRERGGGESSTFILERKMQTLTVFHWRPRPGLSPSSDFNEDIF